MANDVVKKALHDTTDDFINMIRKHASIYHTKIQNLEATINKRKELNLPTLEEELVLQEYKDAAAAIICLEVEVDSIDFDNIIETVEAKKSFIQRVNESLGH